MDKKRLGVGFVGAGFVTRFHIESFQGVRDADVAAVMAPTRQHAEEAAALASRLRHRLGCDSAAAGRPGARDLSALHPLQREGAVGGGRAGRLGAGAELRLP